MLFSPKNDGKERFERIFAEELLEYHFEETLGKNQHNGKPWRVLLDEGIEPHAEILCDFSRWLIARGWNREVVEELFFVVIDNRKPGESNVSKKAGWLRSIFRSFKL